MPHRVLTNFYGFRFGSISRKIWASGVKDGEDEERQRRRRKEEKKKKKKKKKKKRKQKLSSNASN